MTTRERRRHPRVPYGAWVEDETDGGLGFYLACNISMGGMLLRGKEGRPPMGHKVRIRLVIENERRVMSVQGEVVRHDDKDTSEFGVEFTELDDERSTFLDDLLGELAKSKDGAEDAMSAS